MTTVSTQLPAPQHRASSSSSSGSDSSSAEEDAADGLAVVQVGGATALESGHESAESLCLDGQGRHERRYEHLQAVH